MTHFKSNKYLIDIKNIINKTNKINLKKLYASVSFNKFAKNNFNKYNF